MPEVLELRTRAGGSFGVKLGPVLAETPSTLLHEGERALGPGELPGRVAVKRGKEAGDFGRLDLEQVACERLEHPHLARYVGGTRTPELGTVIAFERLRGSPLLVFNEPGRRPAFRDPGTAYFPLPPGIALELAHDVLLALEHVHARGFVHGGVTVGNLHVRTPAEHGEAPDLLAQLAEGAYQGVLAGLGGARELTFLEALRQGQVDPELTPRLPDAVAAPETLLERRELGGRRVYSQAMDSYAFGLLVYTLLTGHTPYDHLVDARELTHPEVVRELKLRETRGEVSPISPHALRDIPLHDSPFVRPASEAWPLFHATVRRLIAGCVRVEPDRRLSPAAARKLLASDLAFQPGGPDSFRQHVLRLFQWLPGSNRLRGDAARTGVWVREEEGQLVVEAHEVAAPQGEVETARSFDDSDPGATISLRTPVVAAKPPPRKRRIEPPQPLRDVVRAFHTDGTLPRGPYLVTTTSLDKTSLARGQVHALGTAEAWVVVTDGGVREQLRLIAGRLADSDIVCPDSMVSKKHAALGFDRASGHWYVEDLKSANGTRVDDKPAEPDQRVKLKRSPSMIVLGTSYELTYMEAPALKDFLRVVLDTIKQGAAAAKAAAREEEGLADEAPAMPSASGDPATRVYARPRRNEPSFPLARATPKKPDWDGLTRRLTMHAEAGATFRIVLTGAVVEHARTVDAAVALLRESGPEVVSLEAEFETQRILIYARKG